MIAPQVFQTRVERTFALLDNLGLHLRDRNPAFVEWWVEHGKLPDEILAIAVGRPGRRQCETRRQTESIMPANLVREIPARPHVTPRAVDDGAFGVAMGALTVAVANADRALRGEPPVKTALDLDPYIAQTYHAAGLEAVLRQQSPAVFEAVNDAAEELHGLVDRLISDPEAALGNDPDRLRHVCYAWVRLMLDVFRSSLAAQLPTLRGQQ